MHEHDNRPRLMTKSEAASFARVSQSTIGRWVRLGLVEVVRLPSGQPRIVEGSLLRAESHK
jgi:predicted site-specific integrase-resolvase